MMSKRGPWILVAGLTLFAAGCHTDMWVQPREEAQMESQFFADGAASRPPVLGTVAVGSVRDDEVFFTGRQNGQLVREMPTRQAMEALNVATYRAFLNKGRERFNIYCAPCHGQVGDGEGMIAQRGLNLRRPPGNYHTDRLREMPDGHFYDVITNGFGVMFSYASRVEPAERWAIVAYIRALQLSQSADPNMVPPQERERLDAPAPTNAPHGDTGH
jgi:mono/diheme cytochrome c family protein